MAVEANGRDKVGMDRMVWYVLVVPLVLVRLLGVPQNFIQPYTVIVLRVLVSIES